jgi:hypothetical protein
MVVAGWSLSGPSGNLCYSVLGVPTLINSDPASTLLFGPLAVQDNKGLIEIFDPSVHGYHNENAKLEECLGDEIRDEDTGLRKHYTCPSCGSLLFSLTAVFYYQQGAIEVFMAEPDLPMSDMFNSFNLYGVCVSCQQEATIAEFDGL